MREGLNKWEFSGILTPRNRARKKVYDYFVNSEILRKKAKIYQQVKNFIAN